jgi:hypothetical protein
VSWLVAVGQSATAGTGYGPAEVGGRAAMGSGDFSLRPRRLDGLGYPSTRLAAAEPDRVALLLGRWVGVGL